MAVRRVATLAALLACLAVASVPAARAFDDDLDIQMFDDLWSNNGTIDAQLTINSNCRTVSRKECEYFGKRDGTVRWNGEAGYWEALLVPSGRAHHAPQLLLRHPPEHPWRWELHAAWFSGSEGRGTVAIAHSKMERFSNQWTDSREVAVNSGRSAQNPVFLWNNETDVIHLLHTSQQGKDQGTSRIQEVTSSDGGDRWSRVDILYDKEGTFLRNHPIRSLDGAWLLPVYHTPLGLWDHASQYSEMMRSDDDGKTWGPIAIMAPPPMACVQPSVVRLANDSLVSFFRDRRDVAIYKTISNDDGYTWFRPWRTVLPNPNKAVQALMLQSGAIAILFDNQKGGKTREHRKLSPMTIALSFDNGTTWSYAKDLENDYDQRLEYAYPTMVQDPQGYIHLAYTYAARGKNRIGIRYIKIWEDWIKTPWKDIGFTIGEYQPPPPPPPAPESPPSPPAPESPPAPAVNTTITTDLANSTSTATANATLAQPSNDAATIDLARGFDEEAELVAPEDTVVDRPEADSLMGANEAATASAAVASVSAATISTVVPAWVWAVVVAGVVSVGVIVGVVAYRITSPTTKEAGVAAEVESYPVEDAAKSGGHAGSTTAV